ncbi:hypothetical protein [Prosthecobacter vanneervenii]|uniref:F5/8 type C domain-containing protein n=1 Tax=Prosthecobacter vanneervenii TaxID=48466 RepID=A0A7W8DJH1_9BACT|nr:hypothetical protein [Prosthecobacter vanneervenii]MBB5032072.1 hypothetical protein [Prosthecobacter vanneervenii]
MKLAPTIILLGSLFTVGSVHAKWSRIPIIKEKPVNVINSPASNASLDSSSGFGHVDSLLSSDITATSTVSAGKSFVLFNLGKPVLISSSSFVNDGIEGRATLSASADKNGWAVLEEKVFSAADRTVEFKFAGIQAKYVKLELALSKGGIIRYLQFFGASSDKGYAVKQSADGKGGKPMDLINGLGGARVVYAAPKPANGFDTAVTYNKFSFPESDEKYRTIIYDFGQLRILNEFASVHSPRPVRFEVFAFDNLPEKEDWRGRMAFDPKDFGNVAPVAVAEDTRGDGSLKAKPAKPVKTRYLALRWEPEFNPPDFQATGSAEGNVTNIVTTNTVVINNPDGSKTTVTITVGDAHGAGAGSSDVKPDNPMQALAQNGGIQTDSSTITTVYVSADGKTTTTTVQQGTTTVETSTVGGVTTTKSTTNNQDGTSTTITEVKNADGTTTTTVETKGTAADGSPTGQATVTTSSTGATSSDGNLGAGNTPAPSTVTPGAPAGSGGTQVNVTSGSS